MIISRTIRRPAGLLSSSLVGRNAAGYGYCLPVEVEYIASCLVYDSAQDIHVGERVGYGYI